MPNSSSHVSTASLAPGTWSLLLFLWCTRHMLASEPCCSFCLEHPSLMGGQGAHFPESLLQGHILRHNLALESSASLPCCLLPPYPGCSFLPLPPSAPAHPSPLSLGVPSSHGLSHSQAPSDSPPCMPSDTMSSLPQGP